MWKRLLPRLQPIFVLLAMIFIVLLLQSQWDELRGQEWQLNWIWLFVSAIFLLASWSLEIQIWRHLLMLIGGRLAYWPAARIWFLSAIVRYIPGNIWQPLSMTLLCKRRGIAPEATLTSILLYQVLILLAAAPIAALYVSVTGNWGIFTALVVDLAPWLVAAGLAPVAIFIVRPSWLIDCVNWALARLNRKPLNADISRLDLVQLLGLTIADWLLWGVSFMALVFALTPYSTEEMASLAVHLIPVYSIAYAIGFVSLLTPSGLGVREGAFYVLLTPVMGGGAATVAALAMRLWTAVGELLAAGVSAVIQDRDLPLSQSVQPSGESPKAVDLREEPT